MARAVIAIGSNIRPEEHLPAAVTELSRAVRVLALSGVYETPPVGAPGTPAFLNMALLVETNLPAQRLREAVLRPIEERLGRVRTSDPNAPRTIDLDLVLYEDEGRVRVLDEGLTRHAHVALPVAEVAPEWPVSEKETVREVAARLQAGAAGFRRRFDVEEQLVLLERPINSARTEVTEWQ